MVLTNKQEEGLRIAVERYKHHEAYTCIAGYAGTGKTTLVKFIVQALDIQPSSVCYISYTGKAALVLKEHGCQNAMTAHKLLYKSYQRRDGTFAHVPKFPLDYPYSLIIVDEISMLPKNLWELLLQHKIPVIAMGDPGQLPPIGESNEVLDRPHVFLDEIMRQAQESEIIRLTMDIRAGKELDFFSGNEVRVIPDSDIVAGLYLWADQIIVGKNDTRRDTNSIVRRLIHNVEDEIPIIGDRIICLRNDWEMMTGNEDVLVNGLIGTLTDVSFQSSQYLDTMMMGTFTLDEDDFFNSTFGSLNMDYKLFTTGVPTVNSSNFKNFPKFIRPREFDYGYCITCHKSQGSEYNKVLVFEEFLRGNDHKKWLYTAATRAKEKLIIVKKGIR